MKYFLLAFFVAITLHQTHCDEAQYPKSDNIKNLETIQLAGSRLDNVGSFETDKKENNAQLQRDEKSLIGTYYDNPRPGYPFRSVSQLNASPHTQVNLNGEYLVDNHRNDHRHHSHDHHEGPYTETNHANHNVYEHLPEREFGSNLVQEVLDNSLISTRNNPNSTEHENIIDTLQNLQVGEDGRKCINKIMMIKETVYDEVLTCDHSYDER